jgi:hypothetical protein
LKTAGICSIACLQINKNTNTSSRTAPATRAFIS